jgi:addiction module RelE/StbE family toxin
MAKLREAILLLIDGSPLPARYKDHPLAGDWRHFRDCHVEPDWLLIYKIDGDDLHLVRYRNALGSVLTGPAILAASRRYTRSCHQIASQISDNQPK